MRSGHIISETKPNNDNKESLTPLPQWTAWPNGARWEWRLIMGARV
jgi:hypothetical protein